MSSAQKDSPGYQAAALSESASDQFFRVRWSTERRPYGAGDAIIGDVFNYTDRAVHHIQLRVIALDASGKPIGSFVEEMFGSVPSHDRTYFFVAVPVHAASYRVAVDTFSPMVAPEAP